jgi:hypothetical protein
MYYGIKIWTTVASIVLSDMGRLWIDATIKVPIEF